MFNKVFTTLVLGVVISSSLFADKLLDVKNLGVLKVGVKYNFEPFSFIDETDKLNNVVGFDIELLKYIAKEWNVELVLEEVTSKNDISMIQSGKIDLLSSLAINQIDNNNSIDFTQPYFFGGVALLVNENSKKKSLTSLSGSRVGMFKGSISGKKLREHSVMAIIVEYEDYLKALDDLKKGSIDAITADLVWCSKQVKNSHGKFKIIGDIISKKAYSMGMLRDELNFKDMVNFTIQKFISDGSYGELYKKWFNENLKNLPKMWPVNKTDIKPVE